MPATVVVVDDEPVIVEVVCDVLTDNGMIAVPCVRSSNALSCIREHQPELVILDLQMPLIDGIEIFQAMRAEPQTARIPVLFLTANTHILRDRLPTYQELGAALLPKPFKIITLAAMVEQLVEAA